MPFFGATMQSAPICTVLAKAFLTNKPASASQLSQFLIALYPVPYYQRKKGLTEAKSHAEVQGTLMDTISASVIRQSKTVLTNLLSLVKPVLLR